MDGDLSDAYLDDSLLKKLETSKKKRVEKMRKDNAEASDQPFKKPHVAPPPSHPSSEALPISLLRSFWEPYIHLLPLPEDITTDLA